MSLTSTDVRHMKRWITASFLKKLKERKEGQDLFREGEDRLTSKHKQHIELRIDGPYMRNCGSKGEMCSYVEVNLLCSSTRDESNIYNRENLQGLMQEMLNTDFCIYRTGNVGREDVDDESVVGVMQLLPADMIKVSDFGMVDTNTEVYQAVAEGHYEMYHTLRFPPRKPLIFTLGGANSLLLSHLLSAEPILPRLLSCTIEEDEQTITLVFSKEMTGFLDQSGELVGTRDFLLTGFPPFGAGTLQFEYVSGNGTNTITAFAVASIPSGANPALMYDWALWTGFPAIRDLQGNTLDVITGFPVTNNS